MGGVDIRDYAGLWCLPEADQKWRTKANELKSAALSDVTAAKEYGVSQDFIVKGIEAGQLEFRDGSMWGNPPQNPEKPA